MKSIPVKWILLASLVFYLALTFVSPFSDKHVLLNLEPYPDGIFYINAAQNIAQQGKFIVELNGFSFHPIITPLYAYILAVGFLFTTSPAVFYIVNVVLGVISLICVAMTLKMLTRHSWIIALGLAVYGSHLILLWLPSVPMAENIVLALFSGCLYSYFGFLKSHSWFDLITTIVLTAGLVFSKYTLVGPAGVVALALLYETFSRKNWQQLSLTLTLFILAGGGFLFTQFQAGFNPLFLIWKTEADKLVEATTTNAQVFYSARFVMPNLLAYFRSMIGVGLTPERFLWLQYPLTTLGLVIAFIGGLTWLVVKKSDKRTSLLLLLLFAAQFPLLLIFYVVDQRYIILSVPLVAIGLTYLVTQVQRQKLVAGFIVVSLCIQLLTQLPVLKMLISQNWLQRSVAWQYETVQVFNQQLPPNSYVITVLPPLLVDVYSTKGYIVLPLSNKQEFLNKGQYFWGDQIRYNDLLGTYRTLLEQQKTVFVTNAYLSSQHEFQSDYQQIFTEFKTQKVSEGCWGTCDIYQLSLK